MSNTPPQRTANMVHFPNKDNSDPNALDVYLDTLRSDHDTLDAAAAKTADNESITGQWSFTQGTVNIGVDDTTPSTLRLYGGATFGGTIRIFQGANEDTGTLGDNVSISCDGEQFLIRDAGNVQYIVIDSNGNFKLPQHANQLLMTGDNGVVQSWTGAAVDVSGSRAFNTTYQNTNGYPIFVNITGSAATGRDVQISSDNFSTSTVNVGLISSVASTTVNFWVPDNWYYRVNGTGTVTHWTEVTS